MVMTISLPVSSLRPRGRLLVVLAASLAALTSPAPYAANEPMPGSAETQDDSSTFDVFEFRIDGNTVLEDRDIEAAVYRFLGPKRTIDTVNDAREALEAAYRAQGYLTVFVDIPEQQVTGGIVTLRVTEGRVDRVRISGSRYYSLGRIREALPAVAEGEVPYIPAFQKQTAALNRGSERTVTPVLKTGARPGTLQVDVKVQDQSPLHGGIELNNRQSPSTSEMRLLGKLRYDNLFQREHSAGIFYQTTPLDTSELSLLAATYVMPLPGSDNTLAFFAARLRNDVGAVGDLRALGSGALYGARYVMPLRGTDTLKHSVTFGIDRKDIRESIVQAGVDDITTPLSYTPVSLAYNAAVTGKKGVTRASVTVNTALRGFLGNSDAEFQRRRSQARANFFVVRPEIQREQILNPTFTLVGRVSAQAASQPLVSFEGFFAGGLDSVRGYLEVERAGDMGMFSSLELRAPGLRKPTERVEEFTPFAFVDAATVRLLKPLPSETSRYDLLSAGVGLRVQAYSRLTAQFVAGWPFEDGLETRRNHPRFTARVAYDF